MSRRRTSSATSRPPSRKSSTTTTTISKRKRESWTAPASSNRKKSTDLSSTVSAVSSVSSVSSVSPAGRAVAVYIGLGSNLGRRRARLERAVELIRRRAPVLALSSFYRTDPVGHTDQPDFVNAVAKIAWRGSPEDLLAYLKRIEARLGRVRRFQNGPREIDLDVLDFGGLVRRRPDPVLPHPRMSRRRFVLAPLSEIAPRWKHPVSGRTARQLLARLPARPSADRLGG